jgi:uncharacterized protein YkwD
MVSIYEDVGTRLPLVFAVLALSGLPTATSSAAVVGVAGQRAVAGPRNDAAKRSSNQTAASSASPFVAPIAACPLQNDLDAPPAVQEAAMECLIDFARHRVGIEELTESADLRQSAADKAADVLSCDDFSHFACGREFSYWIEQTGYMSAPCWHVGENLAWGAGEYGSARSIFTAWMRSPAHRDNLLGAYADTGISVQVGELGGFRGIRVWAAHFGSHCD